MDKIKSERQSGIELLRIICAIGVVILHYNNSTLGGGDNYSTSTGLVYLLAFIESTFICVVNIFFIISGYYLSSTQKRKISKILFLFMQTIILQSLMYCSNCLIHSSSISFVGLFSSIFGISYFIIQYSIIYLLSPLLNIVVQSLNKENFSKIMIVLFVVFSIYPYCLGILTEFSVTSINWSHMCSIGYYGTQNGYNIINFSLCYLIGSYIRKNKFEISKPQSIGLILFLDCAIFLTYFYFPSIAFDYSSPFILLISSFIFILFLKTNIKSNFINESSKGCFTCFIINTFFFQFINIKIHFEHGILILLCHMFLSSIIIYFISYVIFRIYRFLLEKRFENSIVKLDSKINIIPQIDPFDKKIIE